MRVAFQGLIKPAAQVWAGRGEAKVDSSNFRSNPLINFSDRRGRQRLIYCLNTADGLKNVFIRFVVFLHIIENNSEN